MYLSVQDLDIKRRSNQKYIEYVILTFILIGNGVILRFFKKQSQNP